MFVVARLPVPLLAWLPPGPSPRIFVYARLPVPLLAWNPPGPSPPVAAGASPFSHVYGGLPTPQPQAGAAAGGGTVWWGAQPNLTLPSLLT